MSDTNTNPPDPTTLVVPAAPPAAPAPGTPGGRVFTEQEVEEMRLSIRREEKDKLYTDIQSVKTQNQELLGKIGSWEEERNKALQAEQDRLNAEAEARRQAEQAEMDAKTLLQTKEQEWEGRFSQMQQEMQADRILQEKERQYMATQTYLARRRAEEAENIAPELLPLVDGATEEEIEASIARFRSASEAILANIAATQPQQPAGAPPFPAAPRVTAPAPYSDTHLDSQQYTLDQLQAMDPKTYAENRHRLLPAANPRRQQGPRPN